MNANAPTTARDPTMVPTAMPAMAPLLRPDPDPDDEDEEAPDVGVTVAAATVSVAVASPESKSADVTLKQGTWAEKSAASTRVCFVRWCWVSQMSYSLKFGRMMWGGLGRFNGISYNISAGIEGLVFAAVLSFKVGPVGELDGCVGPCGGGAGQRGDLVALVAWLDLGDVLDDLFRELALGGGFFLGQCQ